MKSVMREKIDGNAYLMPNLKKNLRAVSDAITYLGRGLFTSDGVYTLPPQLVSIVRPAAKIYTYEHGIYVVIGVNQDGNQALKAGITPIILRRKTRSTVYQEKRRTKNISPGNLTRFHNQTNPHLQSEKRTGNPRSTDKYCSRETARVEYGF